MKKQILILISTLIFSSMSNASQSSDLPNLPPTDEIINPASEKTPSQELKFWDKMLDFFGLGKDKVSKPAQSSSRTEEISQLPEKLTEQEVESKKMKTSNSIEEISQNTSNNLPTPLKEKTSKDNTSKQELTPAELTPIEKSTNQDPANQDNALKLPEGFADDAVQTKPELNSALPPKTLTNDHPPISSNIPDSRKKTDDGQQQNLPEQKTQEMLPTIPTETPKIPQPSIPSSASIQGTKTEKNPNASLTEEVVSKQIEGNEKSEVYKYRKQLQERLNQAQNLPQLPKAEISTDVNSNDSAEADPNQLKFINDEVQVLTLPNDDIVLGEVTPEALFDLMDFSTYITIFWHNYNLVKNEPAREEINNFIRKYDNNFTIHTRQEIKDASKEAFNAIDKNSIYELISLLENYPILQMRDASGNSLLHKAVLKGNYSAVKFLLIKGIDLLAVNNQDDTAMDIAIVKNNQSVITLLQEAGGGNIN